MKFQLDSPLNSVKRCLDTYKAVQYKWLWMKGWRSDILTFGAYRKPVLSRFNIGFVVKKKTKVNPDSSFVQIW